MGVNKLPDFNNQPVDVPIGDDYSWLYGDGLSNPGDNDDEGDEYGED